MDNVASEVSKKIKSAIKAKLTELGAYVDDELPDYIMVLVANRKMKDQMDDDLSLFLGHNTERFTSWLHNVLQKLNAAAVLQLTANSEDEKEEPPPPPPPPVVEQPPPMPEEKKEVKETKKKKDKSSKKKDKKEKKKKKDKKEKRKSREQRESENKEKAASTPPIEDIKIQVVNEKAIARLAKEQEAKKNLDKEEEQNQESCAKTTIKRKMSSAEIFKNEVGELTSEEDDDLADVVDLRPNPDDLALGLEEEAVPTKKIKVNHKSKKETASAPAKKLKTEELPVKKPRVEEKELPKSKNFDPSPPRAKPVSKIVVPSTKEVKKTQDDSSPSKSSVHDRLGPTMVRRIVNAPSKMEKDLNPSRIASNALNSVIKSVVISNQNLNATEGSTTKKLEARVRPLISTQVKSESSENEEDEPEDEAQQITRIVSTVAEVTKRPLSDDNEDSDEPQAKKVAGLCSKVEVAPRPRRGGVQANTALILKAVADAHKSVSKLTKKPPDEKEDEISQKKKEIFTKSYQDRQKQRLTFPSSEDKPVKKIAITVPNVKREKVQSVEMEDRPPSPLLQERRGFSPESEEEIEYDTHEIVEVMEADVNQTRPRLRMDEISQANPRFFVTLDGLDRETGLKSRLGGKEYQAPSMDEEEYIEEVEEWEEVEEEIENGMTYQEVHPPPPPLPTQPTIIPPKHKLKTSLQTIPVKIPERCLYWPSCKEGDNCQYIHPSKLCTTFPSCTFGDKCIYIHPKCKFDAICVKPSCPFTHTNVKRAAPTAVAIKPVVPLPISKIKCKFYPKCTDMNCPFLHPMQPCWYGSSCYTVGCIYSHPNTLHTNPANTVNNKLKWVAPKSSTTMAPSTTTTTATTVTAPAAIATAVSKPADDIVTPAPLAVVEPKMTSTPVSAVS